MPQIYMVASCTKYHCYVHVCESFMTQHIPDDFLNYWGKHVQNDQKAYLY